MTPTDRRNHPQAGDRLECAGDTYEVIGVSDGKVCYKFAHSSGKYYKVDSVKADAWPGWLKAMCNLSAVWVEGPK